MLFLGWAAVRLSLYLVSRMDCSEIGLLINIRHKYKEIASCIVSVAMCIGAADDTAWNIARRMIASSG